ncbi:MAG: hypothetical protein V1774_02350, partial [Candidatus Eisenbacteria bacterium]
MWRAEGREADGRRRIDPRGLVLAAGLALITVAWSGCGRAPRVELPHPDSGRFLTLEEQRALSSGQLREYCSLLDDYLESLRGDIDLARALGDSLDVVADSLQKEQVRLSGESRRLEREVAELKARRTGGTVYVVKGGDTLTGLANLFYGSTAEWRKIYEANKENIEDPQQ